MGDPTGPYVKDAFHRFVIDGQADAVNPDRTGTKAAAYYRVTVPAEGATTVGLRLCRPGARRSSRRRFGKVFADRVGEADEFASITPAAAG